MKKIIITMILTVSFIQSVYTASSRNNRRDVRSGQRSPRPFGSKPNAGQGFSRNPRLNWRHPYMNR